MATPSASIIVTSLDTSVVESVSVISTSMVAVVTGTMAPPPVAREVSSLVVPLVGAVGGAVVLGILVTIIVITAVVW